MELQHVNIKVFVDGPLGVEPAAFIDVFHAWVRDQVMDELLIDVADYRHVPAGPGVLLVGLEADYAMDHADDRWGLRYNRKAPLAGTNHDRFGQALRSAAVACGLLEEHFAGACPFRFSRSELELFINDRALAPNTVETFQACQGEIADFFRGAFGHDDISLTHHDDPRRRFGVIVKTGNPIDWSRVRTDTSPTD